MDPYEHINWEYYINDETRKTIDGYLIEIAGINAKIGLDTPDSEKDLRKGEIKFIMGKIKEIDYHFYRRLNPTKDDVL